MNFLELQKKLKELGLDIFTIDDVAKITMQEKQIIRNKLSLLAKQEKIYRIKKGHYTLTKIENKFLLQKNFKETYIALHSAIEFYQSTTQRFVTLDLITKNILQKKEINGTTIIFHKVKNNLFFGYEKTIIDNTEVFISNIEKTIIDCVYFSSKIYLTEIMSFMEKYKKEINIELLKIYLEKINSSSLNKRIGYLLEKHGIKLKLKLNNKYEKLNINKKEKGIKNKKWKLIINEEL